jgi:hypothetical protein
MMSREPLCRLEAVSKFYRPGAGPRVWAVSDLSLEVMAGEVLGLLGPPGAGKSTVLGLLGAKFRPSSGRVWRAEGAIRRLALLDEPLVPPVSREAMLLPGGAAVVATGSTALAHRLCDRVILLDRGHSPGWLPADMLAPWVSQTWYRIRLKGHLSPRTLHWLEDLTCSTTPEGETVLTGPLPDSAALFGMLDRIERLHLPLLEVVAIDPVEELIRQYATAIPTPGPG